MSDVVIVIPARYGSRRLPGKPLRDIGGVPLIVAVVERLQPLAPTPILVATDHPEVARAAASCGAAVRMTPSDCPSGTDRVAAAVAGRTDTLVVNVQGDEPLVDPHAVQRLIDVMTADASLPMGTLAAPISDAQAFWSEHTVKVVMNANHDALYFSRRPIPWTPSNLAVPPGALQHIGVYAYRREALSALHRCGPVPLERLERLEQLRALHLGFRIRTVTVSGTWIGVDTEADLEAVRKVVTGIRDRQPATSP